MKKTAIVLLAGLMLAGCADSARNVDAIPEMPSKAKASEKTQELAAPTAKTESDSDTTQAQLPADATVLLAATLEHAKTTDKRVMVHLGAPW